MKHPFIISDDNAQITLGQYTAYLDADNQWYIRDNETGHEQWGGTGPADQMIGIIKKTLMRMERAAIRAEYLQRESPADAYQP